MLLLSFLILTVVHQWPQFRGPAGTGIAAAGVKAPVEFGPGKKQLWRIAVPSGHSSPAIWGDRIFLTAFDKDRKMLVVMAFDRRNGKILWQKEVPSPSIEEVHEISSPATATPALDGERVYVYFGSNGLHSFDMEGKLIWSVSLPVAQAGFGSGTSPILTGENVILSRDEGEHPYLLAVDRKTGSKIWKQKQYLGERGFVSGHATPVLWKDSIVMHRAGEVVGFDSKTGERKWWISVGTQGPGTPSPGVDALYVGTWMTRGEEDLRVPLPLFDELLKLHDKDGNGKLSKDEFPTNIQMRRRVDLEGVPGAAAFLGDWVFDPFTDSNKDGFLDAGEWAKLRERFANAPEHGLIAIKPGGDGDLTKTNIAWREPKGVPEIPSPLELEGRVYAVTNGGIVTVVEAKTGKLIYRARLGAGGGYFSSPVAADGKVYFASGEGVISVVAPAEQLNVIARNDLGEPIYATPAIVDNKIYVRTSKHLYAFGDTAE
jgi:outer membrane protein assembly factor BamB